MCPLCRAESHRYRLLAQRAGACRVAIRGLQEAIPELPEKAAARSTTRIARLQQDLDRINDRLVALHDSLCIARFRALPAGAATYVHMTERTEE